MVELTRKELDHLEQLETRLDHLKGDHPERRGDPAYPPGEAAALAWVISMLRSTAVPIEVRMERVEFNFRRIFSRLGAVEHRIREYDREDEEDL